MKDKVYIKNEKEFVDKHPHWMIAIAFLIYFLLIIITSFLQNLSVIPILFVVISGPFVVTFYIIKKLSWDKASGLIGFVKRDNVLYAIRLYGSYDARMYIAVPPVLTPLIIASLPNKIDYAKKSLEMEKDLDNLSKDNNTYTIILEGLLYDIKNNNNDNFYIDTFDYKADMFINKYGFKKYFPDFVEKFYCGYIIMNNPKVLKSNNKWFELSFMDEENNSKVMRFKNVYKGLLDELKNN